MIRLEAPGGGMNARVGVLHPQVVLVRPSVIVDLEETMRRVPYKTSALHPKQMKERKEGCVMATVKRGLRKFCRRHFSKAPRGN